MNTSLTNNLIHFLSQCASSIIALTDDINKEGAMELLAKLEQAKNKKFTTESIPALTLLSDISDTPYTFNFNEIAKDLKWRPSPRADFNAEAMALCTLNDMLDLNGLLAGLIFMSPNQVYPEHKHPPQEVYFVLSGTASWLYGGNEDYRTLMPGDIIYNHPHDLHGIKTKNESLLALYFLWGNETSAYSY